MTTRTIRWTDLDAFETAYAECALWSSTDWDTGQPLDDDYDVSDLSPDLLRSIREDCSDFRQANESDLDASGLSDEQAGHNFWLTRNGHGAGFWDRGLGAVGDRLSDAARAYGGEDWYGHGELVYC